MLQLDHAIATKAEISRKREAMATASKYKRENEKLKRTLGIAKNWKQARAITSFLTFSIITGIRWRWKMF